MARGHSEFLDGLKFKDGKTSQRQVAEDAIKKQLFKILGDSQLKKGDSKDLNETVDQIANNLGLQSNKNQIVQYITQLFQSGEYQFDIDDNGNIRANYGRLYMLQNKAEEEELKKGNEIMQGFKQRVEAYATQLSQQKIKVTEYTLMNAFSEKEIEKDGEWIDIAIFAVIEKRKEIIK